MHVRGGWQEQTRMVRVWLQHFGTDVQFDKFKSVEGINLSHFGLSDDFFAVTV